MTTTIQLDFSFCSVGFVFHDFLLMESSSSSSPSSLVSLADKCDEEFRTLLKNVLSNKDAVSAEAFLKSLAHLDKEVAVLKKSTATDDDIKADIARKEELYKKYSARMEEWKAELMQERDNANEELLKVPE